MSDCRYFAVIPAAGRSRRMGRPKLLAEVDGRPLIDWVLDAWCASRVDKVLIVVRQEQQQLAAQCRSSARAQVLETTVSPRTMRDTLELGLRYIEGRFTPEANDAWLVAPADIPGLTATAIDQVLAAYDAQKPRVIVPQVNGQRGHPVLLPWNEVAALRKLPQELGLNALVGQCDTQCIELPDERLLIDIDTPHDYHQWLKADCY